MLSAKAIIDALGLEPLEGEGGMYRRPFVADETLAAAALPARYGRDKALSTAIYYLLDDAPDSFSALHRLPTEEVYHFYLGDPVELFELHPAGSSRRVLLGSDVLGGQRVQHVVPRGVWQGSRLLAGGRFALMGTTMAPGYDAFDYQAGSRPDLLARYPRRSDWVRRLTREPC